MPRASARLRARHLQSSQPESPSPEQPPPPPRRQRRQRVTIDLPEELVAGLDQDEIKRWKNRVAAARARERTQNEVHELQATVDQLHEQAQKQRRTIANLRAVIGSLDPRHPDAGNRLVGPPPYPPSEAAASSSMVGLLTGSFAPPPPPPMLPPLSSSVSSSSSSWRAPNTRTRDEDVAAAGVLEHLAAELPWILGASPASLDGGGGSGPLSKVV